MKKVVSIGLFALIVYHTLAYVLVFVGSWWQQEHVTGKSDSPKKANTLLKLLLKEYSPTPRLAFCFHSPCWRNDVRIPEKPVLFYPLALQVSSPPPEV